LATTCVGAGGEHDVSAQGLLLENLICLVSDDVSAGNIDAKRARPEIILDAARFVGGTKMPPSPTSESMPALRKHTF